MEAVTTGLLDFFARPMQMVITNPERHYHWQQADCQKLWQDVIQAGQDEKEKPHFLGTIVYIEYGIIRQAHIPRLVLLDGQQRLTAVSLLLAALNQADEAAGRDDSNHRELHDLFLFNSQEKGELYRKLVPPPGEREVFFSLTRGEEPPTESKNPLAESYRFFKQQIAANGVDTDVIYRGIARLTIMDVSTDRFYRNPQEVYDMLCTTGLDDEQKGLIRNWLGLLQTDE